MPARGYEFYLLVFNSISHSFAVLTHEISSWTLEDKIRIHMRACNILCLWVVISNYCYVSLFRLWLFTWWIVIY